MKIIRISMAISCLCLLLLLYKLAIFCILGDYKELLASPLKIIRILISLDHKQDEVRFFIYVCGSFILFFNFLPYSFRKYLLSFYFIASILWFFFRVINIFHVYYAGSQIERDFLTHIDISTFSMLLDARSIFAIGIPIILSIIMFFFLRELDFSKSSHKIKNLNLLFTVSFIIFFLKALENNSKALDIVLSSSEYSERYPVLAISAETALQKSFEGNDNIQKCLSADTVEKMKGFGLLIDTSRQLPYYKKNIYQKPLFSETGVAPQIQNPNIIILAMESLSARFIESLGGGFVQLTPNLDSFIQHSLTISPTYNASATTINGIVSILSSYLPVYSHEDWFDSNNNMKFDLLFIPEALSKRNYKSYGITAHDPNFVKQKKIFKENGFEALLGVSEISSYLNQNPQSAVLRGKACSDRQIFNFLKGKLKDRAFSGPFFLFVSTLDVHPMFKLPDGCIQYSGSNNSILRLVHNTDAAFGDFWNYFKNSEYANNTIIILTADHSMIPGIEYKALLGRKETPSAFDEIPFVIYDPTHTLPNRIEINASQLDIFPTLMHLLNINMPNSFQGLSVLDENGRENHQNILGSHHIKAFYRYHNNNHYRSAIDINKNNPSDDSGEFSYNDYLHWWKYQRWLTKSNRIWNRTADCGDVERQLQIKYP